MFRLIRNSNVYTPVLLCDVCGDPIKRLAEGNLLWDPNFHEPHQRSGTVAVMTKAKVVHKTCDSSDGNYSRSLDVVLEELERGLGGSEIS